MLHNAITPLLNALSSIKNSGVCAGVPMLRGLCLWAALHGRRIPRGLFEPRDDVIAIAAVDRPDGDDGGIFGEVHIAADNRLTAVCVCRN